MHVPCGVVWKYCYYGQGVVVEAKLFFVDFSSYFDFAISKKTIMRKTVVPSDIIIIIVIITGLIMSDNALSVK